MWEEMWLYLQSWFRYPHSEWDTTLIGIGLALAFTAFWLAGYWPPLFKKRWLWAIAIFSALFTVLAIVFIQLPLQIWVDDASNHFWDAGTIWDWWLLVSIPQLLARALVQEGARMVPIVFWWWRSGKTISPKMSMAIGAIAGAGFGVFETVRINIQTLASGWTWQNYQTSGFAAIAGFWDAFFTVGVHIAVSSLIGYGLAKGRGWQFYLIAIGFHLVYNYRRVLLQAGNLTIFQTEIYAAAFALILTAIVLLWFNRKSRETEPDDYTG